MKFASLAYLSEVPPLEQFKDFHVIDLIRSPIQELCIENFPNLQRLRAPRTKLEKVSIKNCPNLEVIDLSYCYKLTYFELENLPKLRALDLRNTKVNNLNFLLPSLEYLDISLTDIANDLPEAPNLLAFDNSGCDFDNFDLLPIANKYPQLQRLRSLKYVDRISYNSYGTKNRIQLDLNKLSEHPSLEHILCGPANVVCDSISKKTHLTMICLEYPKFIKGTQEQFLNTFHSVVVGTANSYNTYTYSKLPDYHSMEWEKAAHLLFGPWGIPKTDFEPKINPPFEFKNPKLLLNDLQPSNMTISEVADKYDMDIAIDHMMGAIFASALGDCLGTSTEFTNEGYARFALDVPLSILWNTLLEWHHSDSFYRGTVTDDTEQAVLIMRTLADCNGEPNLAHFGALLRNWAYRGISEHGQKQALDVGATVYSAISSSSYTKDPLGHALRNTSRSRGNGGAMRTAPVGCFKFWDLNTVIKNALNFNCATHFNDFCAVSVVAISLLIAKNIQRYSEKDRSKYKEEKMSSDEIDETIDEAFDIVSKELSEHFDFDADKEEMMAFLKAKDFESLKLSGRQTGYVMRAAGAAILALRKGMNFEEAMTEVIRWAGDADSNGAVVGGVIGAVVGFSKIPTDITKYLFTGNWEYVEFERMCKVMGINPPPSPFLILSCQ